MLLYLVAAEDYGQRLVVRKLDLRMHHSRSCSQQEASSACKAGLTSSMDLGVDLLFPLEHALEGIGTRNVVHQQGAQCVFVVDLQVFAYQQTYLHAAAATRLVHLGYIRGISYPIQGAEVLLAGDIPQLQTHSRAVDSHGLERKVHADSRAVVVRERIVYVSGAKRSIAVSYCDPSPWYYQSPWLQAHARTQGGSEARTS